MIWRGLAVGAACLLGSAACSSDADRAEPAASSATASTAPDAADEALDDTTLPATVGPSTPVAPSPTNRPVTTSSAPLPGAPPITTDDGITAPAGDEPIVLGPLGSTEIELDTGGGTVQIGGGDVPDLVPATFPRPADLVVQTASETGEAAGFTGVSQLGFDALAELYRDGLAAAGFEVTEETFADGSVAVFGFDGPDGRGEVVISSPAPGGGQSVIVTLER